MWVTHSLRAHMSWKGGVASVIRVTWIRLWNHVTVFAKGFQNDIHCLIRKGSLWHCCSPRLLHILDVYCRFAHSLLHSINSHFSSYFVCVCFLPHLCLCEDSTVLNSDVYRHLADPSPPHNRKWRPLWCWLADTSYAVFVFFHLHKVHSTVKSGDTTTAQECVFCHHGHGWHLCSASRDIHELVWPFGPARRKYPLLHKFSPMHSEYNTVTTSSNSVISWSFVLSFLRLRRDELWACAPLFCGGSINWICCCMFDRGWGTVRPVCIWLHPYS